MAATRLLTRRLRELLRLKYEAGLRHRAIAQACAGLGTSSSYLARAKAAGVAWPLPADLDDAVLEARLFARPVDPARLAQALPEWSQLHQELKRPGVTLQLVWLEYRGAPDRLRLQPLLRTLSPLGTHAEAVDAPGASRRRKTVC